MSTNPPSRRRKARQTKTVNVPEGVWKVSPSKNDAPRHDIEIGERLRMTIVTSVGYVMLNLGLCVVAALTAWVLLTLLGCGPIHVHLMGTYKNCAGKEPPTAASLSEQLLEQARENEDG